MFKYVLLISLLAVSVTAFSKGAPDAACVDLTPQHHVDAQTSNIPYKLLIDGDVKAGGKNKLTLEGGEIKGFLIQARVDGKPVGKMLPGKNAQLLNCGNEPNSITHTKIEDKINKIEFEWQAPNDIAGKSVVFTATVAKQWDIFWVAKPLLKKTAI